MVQHRKIVAEFEDRYGDTRVLHKTRHGLKLARQRSTAAWLMTIAAGELVGRRIKIEREKKGMTLEELCVRAGLASATPKNRMWEIENNVREGGVKLGTLYAIAIALEIPVTRLLPPISKVRDKAKIVAVQAPPSLAPQIPFRVVE